MTPQPQGAPTEQTARVTVRSQVSTALAGLPRRAITRSGGLTIGTGVARLGTLAGAVIVARTLGRADLGRYAAAVAIGAIVVSGPGSGLPIMAIRDVAARRRGRKFMIRAIRAELAVTAVATCFAVIISTAIMGRNALAAELGLSSGLGNMILTLLNLAECIGLGLQLHRVVIFLQVGLGFAVPALTLLALRAGLGVVGAVGALAAASLPLTILGFWALRKPIRCAPDELDTRRLLWRSKSFLGLAAVNGGYQRVDAVVLLAVAGATPTGIYASAYRLLGPFDLMAAGFAQAFLPLFSSLKPGTPRWVDVRRRAMRLYSLAVMPVLIVATVFMPILLVTVFGSSFRSAVTPARILMLSVLPSTLYWPDALVLVALERETVVLYAFLLSTLLDVLLVVTFAARLGAAGAAWAWVAAELSLWFALTLVLHRGDMVPPSRTHTA